MLVIRSMYGILTISGPQKIRMAIDTLAHLGYLHGLFKAIANTNAKSVETLACWKIQDGDMLCRRARRACAPLRADVAGLYNIDHPMMLTLWATILDKTVALRKLAIDWFGFIK